MTGLVLGTRGSPLARWQTEQVLHVLHQAHPGLDATVRIIKTKGDQVLDLLALTFEADGDGPDGHVELVLAGGAAIMLDVDCIEVQLADTGGAWETTVKPQHPAG